MVHESLVTDLDTRGHLAGERWTPIHVRNLPIRYNTINTTTADEPHFESLPIPSHLLVYHLTCRTL